MTDIAKLRKELGEFISYKISLNNSVNKMDIKIVTDKFNELEQYYKDKIEKLEKADNLIEKNYQDIIESLRKENQELHIKLKAETDSNNRTLEIAQMKMKQLELKTEDLIIKKQNNIEDLLNKKIELKKENENLKLTLEFCKFERAEFKDKSDYTIDALQKENQELKTRNNNLEYNFEHWESMKLINQQNTIEQLQKENSELNAQIIFFKSNVQGVQIKNQKDTIEKLLKESEELKAKLDKARIRISKLNNQVAELEGEVDDERAKEPFPFDDLD